LIALLAVNALAQDTAEYGSVTAKMGTSAAAVKPSLPPATPQKQPAAIHLPLRTLEGVEATNRRALEESAGEDAGTLLLRSLPSGARIWVNGEYVGQAPLLLTLAPGNYRVEMRGEQTEITQRRVNVLPGKSQQLALALSPRYPAHVRLR